MSATFRIAACSYEGSLFGWVCQKETDDSNTEQDVYSTTMNWGFNCCVGTLKAIAVSKTCRYVVCGGSDERIRIYDTVLNKAIGELSNHTGTITCLQFVNDTHLISGGEDNALCIWRVHDWTCLHILGGHKEPVNDVAVHPSGKIALSVGRDNTLRLWNLIEGRCAFTRRLKGSADKVCFNETGSMYALVVNSSVQVYDSGSNALLCEMPHRGRVNKVLFVDIGDSTSTCIVSISDDKKLTVFSESGEELAQCDLSGLDSRPKDFCHIRMDGTDSEPVVYLVIASSTGKVVTLDLSSVLDGDNIDEAVVAATSVAVEPRLTCLTAWRVVEAPAKPVAVPEPIVEKDTRPKVSFAEEDSSIKNGKKRAMGTPAEEGNNKKKKKKKRKLCLVQNKARPSVFVLLWSFRPLSSNIIVIYYCN